MIPIPDNTPLVTNPNNQLKHLHLFGFWKKISKLETAYRALIVGLNKDVAFTIRLARDMESVYQRIVYYVEALGGQRNGGEDSVLNLLEVYLKEVGQWHHQNMMWLTLYNDLRWPVGDYQSKYQALEKEKEYLNVHQSANRSWQNLEDCCKEKQGRVVSLGTQDDPRGWTTTSTDAGNQMIKLKQRRDAWPLGTYPWRLAHKRLMEKLYDKCVASLMESEYALRYKFKTVFYMQSIGMPVHVKERGAGEREEHGLYMALTGNIKANKEEIREAMEHWIYGYNKIDPSNIQSFYQTMTNALIDGLNRNDRYHSHRNRFKWLGVVIGVFFMAAGLYFSDLEYHATRLSRSAVKGGIVFVMDLINFREKERYFERQILDVDTSVTSTEVLGHIHQFISEALYAHPDGWLWFARHILKGYFVLLAKEEANEELIRAFSYAAAKLDSSLEEALLKITALYRQNNIRESQLRGLMFRTKKIFVKHDIYPFLFLIINKGMPYLFIFPEKIISKMTMESDALAKLGIDLKIYEDKGLNVQVNYVQGDQYPFKSASGYFEGEYAIVFTSLAPQPIWTGLHEIGHVVESMRFRFENLKYHPNVEINAMLFPMIFLKDPHDYITHRIIPFIEKRKKEDYYVQGAKGILNGVMIYYAQQAGIELPGLIAPATPPLEGGSLEGFISDQFEGNRIEQVKQVLMSMSATQINDMALSLYQDQKTYLDTAQAGRYPGVETNVEEMIYGLHDSPEKQIVFTNIWSSLSGRGGKFIRDGGGGLNLDAIRMMALKGAIAIFFSVIGVAVVLHVLATPIRIRKYKGRSLQGIIAAMYRGNSWSDGQSYGDEKGGKEILEKIILSSGKMDRTAKQDLEAFILSASEKERLLFHAGLSLAPFNPVKSETTNKHHLVLFYWPFIGPYIARSRWIFFAQKNFNDKEKFNQQLEKLVVSIGPDEGQSEFLSKYEQLLSKYEIKTSEQTSGQKRPSQLIDDLEKMIFDSLHGDGARIYLDRFDSSSKVGVYLRRTGRKVEFDMVQKYMPGDDIREVDWNVTARSPQQELWIRKRVQNDAARVSLFLNLNLLNKSSDLRVWVRDFVNSLKVLRQDTLLKKVILLLPNGNLVEEDVNWRTSRDPRPVAGQVLKIIGENYQKVSVVAHQLSAGLKFYSQEENQRYTEILKLADKPVKKEYLLHKKLKFTYHNVFLIGFQEREMAMAVECIPKGNRIIYWQNGRFVFYSSARGLR